MPTRRRPHLLAVLPAAACAPAVLPAPAPAGEAATILKGFGRRFGSCILALAARQPEVRRDGLDGRMAIHGTDRPALLGRRGSLGCLRASDVALRGLVRDVPVGTPVTVAR